MNIKKSYIFVLVFLQLISKNANSFNIFSNNIFEDTILSYPFLSNQYGGLFMNLPDNFTKEVVYDEDTDKYILYQRIGNTDLFTKKIMTFQTVFRLSIRGDDEKSLGF